MSNFDSFTRQRNEVPGTTETVTTGCALLTQSLLIHDCTQSEWISVHDAKPAVVEIYWAFIYKCEQLG